MTWYDVLIATPETVNHAYGGTQHYYGSLPLPCIVSRPLVSQQQPITSTVVLLLASTFSR